MSIIVLALIMAVSEVQPPVFAAANEELHGYLLEAGENSPVLQARHEEWTAALERIPQVTALDDPMFTFGYFLQSEINDYKVMLGQKFPWFGTLRTRGEKASLEADAALARFYNERNRVFAEVKKAYSELTFLGESIRVTESQLTVLDYMEDIVRSKYEVGMASEDALIRVSIEKTKVRDRRDGFLRFRPALTARFNEALGTDITKKHPWPQQSEFPPKLPPQEALRTQLKASNPDLKRLDYMIESRRKQVVLAKKKGLPDFSLGLEYMSMGKPSTMRPDRPYPATLNSTNRVLNTLAGNAPFNAATTAIDMYVLGARNEPMSYPNNPDDNLAVSVKVNLPIWRKKIKARVAEAHMLEDAATHEKRRRTLELEKAFQMALFTFEDAERRYRLFQDSLLPQARRSYDSLQSQYATGDLGTSFLDVLDSIQTLLAFELEQVRAARDWQIGAADLEFLLGGPWERESGT